MAVQYVDPKEARVRGLCIATSRTPAASGRF
jgi:hypothetical protein